MAVVVCLSFFSENHSPCRTFSEHPFKCLRQSATSMLKSVHNSLLCLQTIYPNLSRRLRFCSHRFLLYCLSPQLGSEFCEVRAYLHSILSMQHRAWHTVTIFAEWMDEEMGVENAVKSLISDRTGLAPNPYHHDLHIPGQMISSSWSDSSLENGDSDAYLPGLLCCSVNWLRG